MKYLIVKDLINMQVMDLWKFSGERLRELNFSSSYEVKQYYLRNPLNPVIGFSAQMNTEREVLQDVLNRKLYRHYRVERMTEKAKRIIKDIFDVYRKNPQQLPYDVWQRNVVYSDKEQLRVICNYIAGMTDRFALDEHKKLFNPYQKV